MVIAVLLRLWTILDLRGDIRIQDPILDGKYYLDLATRLSSGQGWPSGPFFMTPLYPLLLSFLFAIGPVTPLAAHVAQAALGVATLLLLFTAARRDLGDRAALFAAALFAFSGPVLCMEAQVLTESLLLFLASLALVLWPRPGRSAWVHLAFGVVCGLLIVGRGGFVFLPLAALAASLWTARRALRLAAIVAGIGIALAPVAIHQTRVTGHLHLLTLNGGVNLYLGNNPEARGIYCLPEECHLESDYTATESASVLAGRTLTLEESSSFWQERALRFLGADPARAAWLLTRKMMFYVSPWEIPQIEDFQILAAAHPSLGAGVVRFWLLLPLAALGVATLPRERRSRLVPWGALIVTGFLSTTLFFATGRYRISVLAGFLGVAGVGAEAIIGWIRTRRVPRAAAILPLVFVAQFLLPSYSRVRAEAFDAYQLAVRLGARGRLEEALAAYQRAGTLEPEDGSAWHGVGATLVSLGRLAEAVAAYERSVALAPRSPLTWYNLAITRARLGREDLAIQDFRRSLEIDPRNAAVRSDYGIALFRTGQRDAAIAEWREALRLRPGYEPARRGLQAAGLPN